VKQIYGRKITGLKTTRFVFTGHIKMCTQSIAFKDAAQLQRKKWKVYYFNTSIIGKRLLQPLIWHAQWTLMMQKVKIVITSVIRCQNISI